VMAAPKPEMPGARRSWRNTRLRSRSGCGRIPSSRPSKSSAALRRSATTGERARSTSWSGGSGIWTSGRVTTAHRRRARSGAPLQLLQTSVRGQRDRADRPRSSRRAASDSGAPGRRAPSAQSTVAPQDRRTPPRNRLDDRPAARPQDSAKPRLTACAYPWFITPRPEPDRVLRACRRAAEPQRHRPAPPRW